MGCQVIIHSHLNLLLILLYYLIFITCQRHNYKKNIITLDLLNKINSMVSKSDK